MFRNNLESIQGIGIYPVLSLIIFFGFFAVMGYWLYKTDKSWFESISRLPIEDESTNETLNA